MNRRLTFAALAVAGLLAATAPAAHAQDYPTKPIKLIVDGPAGGINDIWARRYANVVGPALKQTIVIDNRTGASGSISAEALTQAAPDGYTMYFGGMNPLILYPGAGGKVRYDPVKDFLPIALGTMGYPTLVAGSGFGAKTVAEAIAKVGSTERTCGTGGNASVAHFACVQFARAAKLKLLTVPYKAAALAALDAAANQIDFSAAFYSEIEALTSAGRLVPLAVYGPQRLPKFPNVPTMAEAGMPGIELPSFSGFFVPAGTPMTIVTRLHTELLAAMKTPELSGILANAGGVYQVMTQPAFADFYRQEIAKWKKLSADTGIRVEQ
jgi:tripartite-type tricarboxylate transporter receptor subunit TctC